MEYSYSNSDDSNSADQYDQTEHDILASLAIVNGFGSALEESYGELTSVYKAIVQSVDSGLTEDSLDQLRKHEKDCQYCLTRLVKSTEQLKSRLDDAVREIENGTGANPQSTRDLP